MGAVIAGGDSVMMAVRLDLLSEFCVGVSAGLPQTQIEVQFQVDSVALKASTDNKSSLEGRLPLVGSLGGVPPEIRG